MYMNNITVIIIIQQGDHVFNYYPVPVATTIRFRLPSEEIVEEASTLILGSRGEFVILVPV